MTRSTDSHERGRNLRVKDIVIDILERFAGGSFEVRDKMPNATEEAVTKWFADASKIGEERYVLSQIFGTDEDITEFNPALFEVLTHKFPDRLPDVYRTVIDDHPELREKSWQFAEAVSHSQLAADVMLKILEYAARHDAPEHNIPGIHFLRAIDPKQAQGMLLKALEQMPTSPHRHQETLTRLDFQDDDRPEWQTMPAWLVAQNSDSLEWQALAKAIRGADVRGRLELLSAVARNCSPQGRKQRLAFLELHLTDDAAQDATAPECFHYVNKVRWVFIAPEVRNYAAMRLAEMLKIDADTRPDWTTTQWAELRKRVAEAVAKELGR